MRCRLLSVVLCILASGLTGCGNSQSGGSPDGTVREFLEAVRVGNSKKATSLLTPLTRQKTAEMKLDVAPDPSETAKFEVGSVEYVTPEKDGAHVACKWTDIDDQKQPYTREYLWILRKEDEGWRIAGMAAKVFADSPPLILNFEDPQDMVRKQELLAEEIARREAEQQALQAKQGPPQDGRR